jgi:WD40 repeat protein
MSFPATTQAIWPHQKFEGHSVHVSGVIHLPGGQRIITCSYDGSLRVWSLESGTQIEEDWRDGESAVIVVALSPDGKKVVSGSGDGALRLWDIDTGKIITKWTGHAGSVNSLCWNRDGGRVVSGSFDGMAMVWDVDSGESFLKVGPIETGLPTVEAVTYSPCETMIATGSISLEKEFIKIWDARTGILITSLKGHRYTVTCLAWTADGRTLISGSLDDSIRTWNTSTWQQMAVLTGHTSGVYAIVISSNGILASTSIDGTARLWCLENGQPIGLPLHHHHANLVSCVSFSADGNLLATGCDDKNAYSWDISVISREPCLNKLIPSPNVCYSFLISLHPLNTLSQENNKSLLDVRNKFMSAFHLI